MPAFFTHVDVDQSELINPARVAGVHPEKERGIENDIIDCVDAPVQLGVDHIW